jgi:predicted glycoside hydrolase/deacetylase ChbG (UPF0249 family)
LSRPKRVIIFNADDFGLTARVNAGIIKAHDCGLLRSASLMVSTPGFEDAVELARHHPGLDLGIHLALTGVRPVLPLAEVQPLLGAGDRFPPLRALLPKLFRRQVDGDAVRRELRAQMERALATGLAFSHLDGHHHVHLFEPVATVVGELAREFGIPFVRRVRHTGPLWGSPPWSAAKRLLLQGSDQRAASAFLPTRGLDAFRGAPFPTDLDAWRRMIHGLPEGTTEFMCHPGYADPSVAEFDPLIEEREVELSWLCDPAVREMLGEAGVRLASFADLLGTHAIESR